MTINMSVYSVIIRTNKLDLSQFKHNCLLVTDINDNFTFIFHGQYMCIRDKLLYIWFVLLIIFIRYK